MSMARSGGEERLDEEMSKVVAVMVLSQMRGRRKKRKVEHVIT